MFPGGRGMFSRKTWQCPWCGTAYRDGDTCPHDEEHWSQFMVSLRGDESSRHLELVGTRSRGVA